MPTSSEETHEARSERWRNERVRSDLGTFVKEHWHTHSVDLDGKEYWSITIKPNDPSGDVEIFLRNGELELRYKPRQ